jgi:DNA-binding HxlR family transcriptional regulator
MTGLSVILKKDEVDEKKRIPVQKYYKYPPQLSDHSYVEQTYLIEFFLKIMGDKGSIQILRELFLGSRRTDE